MKVQSLGSSWYINGTIELEQSWNLIQRQFLWLYNITCLTLHMIMGPNSLRCTKNVSQHHPFYTPLLVLFHYTSGHKFDGFRYLMVKNIDL
jgi:hypothetical protein